MNKSNAINHTQHTRVAIIKAVGNNASKEEITTLLQACLKELGIQENPEMQEAAQTITELTGDNAFRRVMDGYFNQLKN
ncbi:hypothetical protein [Aneurinibacillus tyrosinisolvens]|uniref:hypothetical protein n=1 Tax=Aneurinibacillus tyrosinisolvens TaxID=1443435 RepID=UPI00063EF1DA|nr:hypothetical protein [Aneurinibacillus tyrosinisolvens]